MKLDLLAIAAHPDDVELTCGGTLIKMAQRGYKTGVLDLTAGEMGTRGTPETRAKEASKAAAVPWNPCSMLAGIPKSFCTRPTALTASPNDFLGARLKEMVTAGNCP